MARVIKTLGIAILVVLLSTAILAGAEEAGHAEAGHSQAGHEQHHDFDWMGFLGKLFNSTVLFGGLIVFLRKPLVKLLSEKSLGVKEDILKREEQLKTTSGALEEIRQRLEKIESEVEGMKDTAHQKGVEEQNRIEEAGKKEAQRIMELTDAEIETKIENSIRTMKARIADLTIDHFKSEIQSQLKSQDHEKIIEKNIEISGDIIERE